jgi:hypothetical protein
MNEIFIIGNCLNEDLEEICAFLSAYCTPNINFRTIDLFEFELIPDKNAIIIIREPVSMANFLKIKMKENFDLRKFVIEYNLSLKKIVELFDIGEDPYINLYPIYYEDFITNNFDKKHLEFFLGLSINTLPTYSRRQNTPFELTLSPLEIRFIFELIDLNYLDKVKNIIVKSRKYFYQKVSRFILSLLKTKKVYSYVQDKQSIGADYGEFTIKDSPFIFRGRKDYQDFESFIKYNNSYGVAIGSASTFGRFVKRPYPEILEEKLGFPILNLGVIAGRPETYLSEPALIKVISNAKFVIKEVMSPIGYSSPYFESFLHCNKLGFEKLPLDKKNNFNNHYAKHFQLFQLSSKFAHSVYQVLLNLRYLDISSKKEIYYAFLRRYFEDAVELYKLNPNMILLYLTQRVEESLTIPLNSTNVEDFMGKHPHTLDDIALMYLKQIFSYVIECRSRAGMPSIVKHWVTDEPVPVFPWRKDNPSMNTHYASQEMHEEAANLLYDFLKRQFITEE